MAAVGSLAARVRGYPGTPARGRTAQAVAQKVISWKSGWAGGVPGWRHWGGGSSTAFRAQGGSSRVDGGGGREAGGGSSGGGAEDGRRGCRGEGERGRGGLVHDAVALEEAQEGRIEVGRLEAGHVQVDLLD